MFCSKLKKHIGPIDNMLMNLRKMKRKNVFGRFFRNFRNWPLTTATDSDRFVKRKCGFVPYSFYLRGVLRFLFYIYDVIQILFSIRIKSYNHSVLKRIFLNMEWDIRNKIVQKIGICVRKSMVGLVTQFTIA